MLQLAAPVWIAGLVFFLLWPSARRLRTFGWMWVAVFLLLALSSGKRAMYLAPAFTWLLPAGALVIERLVQRFGRPVRIAIIALILAGGMSVTPFVVPILPEATLAGYVAQIPNATKPEEAAAASRLPEFLSHMSGWDEIVTRASAVYAHLPPADRVDTMIIVPNYGVASAIDVLGRPMGLPPASSGHNSYWFWGPRGRRDRRRLSRGARSRVVRRCRASR